jgi:hypothetical protein
MTQFVKWCNLDQQCDGRQHHSWIEVAEANSAACAYCNSRLKELGITSGGPVTSLSDVYALRVILHQAVSESFTSRSRRGGKRKWMMS